MKIKRQSGAKLFILEGLKKFRQIGNILPSSKYLGKSMAKLVKNSENQIIVELGAGTGAITKEILKKIPPSSQLFAFENNKELAGFLRNDIKDPRLTVVEQDARLLADYLASRGGLEADCVVSCLPLGTFKKPDRELILESIKKSLKDNGSYLQYQYFLASIAGIKKYFSKVKIKNYELRNIPPAFIYECQK